MLLERYHENPEVFHVNTLADRAYYIPYESRRAALRQRREESGRFHALNGRWDFRYFERIEDVPQDIAAPGFDWIDADGIDVPCSWQAQGYGAFQYVNIDAIIPYDYPRVPADNPCGAYHTAFCYRENRRAPAVELVFEGVDSCFYVWLNGRFVGYSQVSHATSIFDVSELLVPGENHLVVLNLKYCDGTYFENQDKFRLTGIFRDVYLLRRPRNRVRDFFARTELSSDFASARLRVEVEIENPRSGATLTAELLAPDGSRAGEARASAESEKAQLRFDLERPLLWNAEEPRLYRLLLRLGGECIPQQIGFREVSVADGTLCVNGRPIKLKGVNMHESAPRSGNAIGPFQYDLGLRQMKQNNINAIRTSHYPCPPVMMEYCNRYGFYVISEADLETHGAGQSEGVKGYNRDGYCRGFHELASALMDDPACREAVLDRVRKNPIRDKNQCAAIIWSLGNESSWGENLERAGRWVKRYDPSRLVHYENLYPNPRRTPDYSMLDLISRMYPSLEWIRARYEGTDFDPKAEFIACMGEFTERYLMEAAKSKPLVLCEFTHAMGNSCGDAADYFDLIYAHPGFAGGFVWEWRDHAQYAGDERGGRPKFLYGGDMGEFPNDGNFCIDGLTGPDGAPHSSLTELRNVMRPARSELRDGAISMRNCLDFANLRDCLRCLWELGVNGEIVARGELELPSIPPHERATLPLPCATPPAGWCYLRLRYCAKSAAPALPAGCELGFDQLELRAADSEENPFALRSPARGALRARSSERRVAVCGESERGAFRYVYDKRGGAMRSLVLDGRELLSRPMEFNLYRAPTDNDLRGLEVDARWRDLGYDRALTRADEPKIATLDDGSVEIATRLRFAAVGRRCALWGDARWRIAPDGTIRLRADMRRDGALTYLPRFGLRLFLREDLGRGVDYFGLGPGESYVDKRHAAWTDRFRTDVDSLFVDYIRPQENGSHCGCRYLRVGDGPAIQLFTEGGGTFSFNASRYSQEALARAAHNFELSPGRETVVCADYMLSGIGSGSCGPALGRAYRLDAEEFCFELSLLPC